MFTEDELINKPKRIQKENDRLVKILFSLDDDDFDYDKFIEENASEEYKIWRKEKKIYDAENLKKGIIAD